MKLRLTAAIVVAATLIVGAFLGREVIEESAAGGWSHEAGEAWDAERALQAAFDRGRPNFLLLIQAVSGDVDAPEVEAAAAEIASSLEERQVGQVESYWSLGRPNWYRTDDGAAALLTTRLGGSEGDAAEKADDLISGLRYDRDVIAVTPGGEATLLRDTRAATVATLGPLAIVAIVSIGLVLLFSRNWRATVLVAVTSATAVALTFAALWAIDQVFVVTAHSVVLVIAVAWGLASGGGFVFVTRFMSERRAGAPRPAAVVATVGSAGRIVAIAATVAFALGLSLWVMPTATLQSTAYGLGAAAFSAGVSSVLLLGLLLAVFGAGIEPRHQDTTTSVVPLEPADRVTRYATSRALMVSVITVALLGTAAIVGFASLSIDEPGPETVLGDAPSRRVANTVIRDFATNEADAPFVVASRVIEFSGSNEQILTYAMDLSRIEGVARVDSAQGTFVDGAAMTVPEQITARHAAEGSTWFQVPVEGAAEGAAATGVVDEVDAATAPFLVDVGGQAARQAETVAAVEGRAPLLAGLAVALLVVLAAWLLRGLNAAIRLGLTVVLVTAGAALVLWLVFVEGVLARVPGLPSGGSIAAVVPPSAWILSMALCGAWLVLAWGSVRETFDVAHDESRSTVAALRASRSSQLQAAVLLWLPLVPLTLPGWQTLQATAAAVIGAAMVCVVLGRFVLLPALTAIAPSRLWPRDSEGNPVTVFAPTATTLRLAAGMQEAVDTPPVPAPDTTPIAEDSHGEHGVVVAADRDNEPGAPDAEPGFAVAGREPEAQVADGEPDITTTDARHGAATTAPPEDVPDTLTEPLGAAPAAGSPPTDETGVSEEATAGLAGEATIPGTPGTDADEEAAETGAGDEGAASTAAVASRKESRRSRRKRKKERFAKQAAPADDLLAAVIGGAGLHEERPAAISQPEGMAGRSEEGPDDGEVAVADQPQAPSVDAEARVEEVVVEVAVEEVAVESSANVEASAEPAGSDEVAVAAPPGDEVVEPTTTGRDDEVATVAPRAEAKDEQTLALELVSSEAGVDGGAPDGTPPKPAAGGGEEPAAPVADQGEPTEPAAGDQGEPTEPAAPDESEAIDEQMDHETLGVTELHVAEVTDRPAPARAATGTVDVVSLTESVIASLDAGVPFTTEIGSGYVANPSNNLSRVMEAILRDASRRGGDEILVYGHASRGRYRWMVVDSGPRADHDPERARTLAEAQRFIRRVGGVVECRPEGDFTVFVVEIPMAS